MRQAAEPAAGRTGGRRIIERPRLIKLLEGTSARTILLIAPAGYGKTTLARQWAERQTDVHWYTARTGSADVAQLAVDLAAVLGSAAPGLDAYATQLVQALPNPSHNAAEIAHGIAAFAGDLSTKTLVVDDFHAVAEDDAAAAVLHEVQLRTGVRLLVASRIRPPWASARLLIYGELLEVGADELALTGDEVVELLGRRSAQVVDVLQRTRGWPAVVGLAAQADAELSSRADTATTLFRYVAEELFRASSQELQEQLLTLALLPSLSRSLVDHALQADSQPIIERAIESGLATTGEESAELHPLVREYLLAKLARQQDADERVRRAVLLSLERGLWDHAFELVTRFKAVDLLDELIERSFTSLLSSGRIATAEQIAAYGHLAAHVSPLVDLIDAELAFRNGLFSRAEAVAVRAAQHLRESHRLASHAWWIAGQGAQLSFEDHKALRHFEKARETALTDEDLRNALWGVALTACQAEAPTATAFVQPLLARRDRSPIDQIRATAAEIVLERIVGSGASIQIDQALHALEPVTDPRIRTSFLNACAYYLILRAQYDDAQEIAERMRETADAYQLTWAQPHAYWALAAVALGRRQMAECNTWLRRVERSADERKFGPLLLNASCLRARQLLALGRPESAWSALTVDETLPANRGMRGEFYAIKALTLAVMDDADESRAWAERARDLTSCIEVRAYVASASSVVALRGGASPTHVGQIMSEVGRIGVWDAFISTVRASPSLLGALGDAAPLEPTMIAALRRAYDFDLSRQLGLDIGRRPRAVTGPGRLSPRETEVLDLIGQGLSNHDIARALFISKSTVKVHVRHILDKTGARSRTEAATMRDG
jgi:LuxR family transcriptional regulator, maltose regulon positive regulatory protein